jgi:hypothetical protein
MRLMEMFHIGCAPLSKLILGTVSLLFLLGSNAVVDAADGLAHVTGPIRTF